MSRFTITVTEQSAFAAGEAARQSVTAPAARQSINAPAARQSVNAPAARQSVAAPTARQSVMARQSVPGGPAARSCAPPAPATRRDSTTDLAPLT